MDRNAMLRAMFGLPARDTLPDTITLDTDDVYRILKRVPDSMDIFDMLIPDLLHPDHHPVPWTDLQPGTRWMHSPWRSMSSTFVYLGDDEVAHAESNIEQPHEEGRFYSRIEDAEDDKGVFTEKTSKTIYLAPPAGDDPDAL